MNLDIENSISEKDPGVLVDHKLNTKKQYTLAAKKNNSFLCCIRKCHYNRSWEVILHFFLALVRPHLHGWVQF